MNTGPTLSIRSSLESALTLALRLVAACCLAALVSGCGGGSPAGSAAGAGPGGAGDSGGSGEGGLPDQRLVVLSPAVAVMLRDLGLADRVVGKHDYDLVLPDTVPAVGHQEALDYEAILAANPTEVIIEWGSRPLPPRLTELSERRGWAVRRVTLLTIDDIARTVDDLAIGLGAVSMRTNAPRRPEGVPEDLEGLSGAIRFEDPASRFDAALPSATLARAWSRRGDGFAGVGPVLLLGSTTPPGVLGPGSFHDQILRRVGGVPAIDTGAPWMELDAEDVLRLDPAAIVLISPRGAGTPPASPSLDALRDRLGRLGTLNIRAVREGRIALIDDPLALLPSTAMAGFADRLAEVLEAWTGPAASPGP